MAERDAGAVDVDPFEVGLGQLPVAEAGEDLSGECLVDSIRSMSVRETDPLERFRHGRDGADAHAVRFDSGEPQLTELREGAQSEPFGTLAGVVTMAAAPPSFCPQAFPAVTVASGSRRRGRGLGAAGRVGQSHPGRGCSSALVTTSSSARRDRRDGDRERLLVEQPFSSPFTARSCERTAQPSCSVRLMSYSRRRFSAVSIMPPSTGKLTATRVGCGGSARRSSNSAPTVCVPTRHWSRIPLAHAFGAARDHQITPPVLDLHAGVDDRLQTRSAAAVDLNPAR